MLLTTNLLATNAMQNCKNSKHTWTSRTDSTIKHRIDYLCTQLNKTTITNNLGAVADDNWRPQGADEDHKPIIAHIQFTSNTKRQRHYKQTIKFRPQKYSRSELKKAWEAQLTKESQEQQRQPDITKRNEAAEQKATEFNELIDPALRNL